MMAEWQKLSTWIPTIGKVEMIHERSVFKRLFHIRVDLPLPFSNRDLLLEGAGRINEEDKSVCFLMKSFYGKSYFGIPTAED